MTKVKICGLTRLEDALAALRAGADFLGFILYPPSPRAVSPEQVAEIAAKLRRTLPDLFARPAPPLLVGVFVNNEARETAELLARCSLDLAQLSGDEGAEEVIDLSSPLYGMAYKAVRPRTLDEAMDFRSRYAKYNQCHPTRPSLLLDTPHAKLYGGTGETGDWSIAAELARVDAGIMLAGGLNPANVAEVVRQARPFAVDVAGGVESAPGFKDHTLIKAFIDNAKSARAIPQ